MSYPKLTGIELNDNQIFFLADSFKGAAKIRSGFVDKVRFEESPIRISQSVTSHIRQQLQKWYNENHETTDSER